MRDKPTGAELLAQARAEFTDKFLKNASGEHKYSALMIASAMAIAQREYEAGDRPLRDELAAFSILYDEDLPVAADILRLEEVLLVYNRRLAAEIRKGQFDSESQIPEFLRDLSPLACQFVGELL